MILHIPHASPLIPDNLRNQIILSEQELASELRLMTDWFVDELFVFPEASVVRFPISRLLVDVERYAKDADEPMSRVGMGVIYTSTAHGKRLKRKFQPEEREMLLLRYYRPHHQELEVQVEKELSKYGSALIVDCHSFPSHPLPCDVDQTVPRPPFCIGKAAFHTPDHLVERAEQTLMKLGHVPLINRPYIGSIVPASYDDDPRVLSIMIEVNRSLYMDEIKGTRRADFAPIREQVGFLLSSIRRGEKSFAPVR